MNKKLIGPNFITQAYLRRYGMTARAKRWLSYFVHIETENGVWRTDGHGYTYAGKDDAWVLPFKDAMAAIDHCGPEKQGRFLFVRKDHGIYVAFDRDGRHFAYAKHPNAIKELPGLANPNLEAWQQRKAVDAYRAQARRLGGKVELLNSEEYQRRVVDNPDGMRT